MRREITTGAVLAAGALLVAGCSSSVSTSDLEAEISAGIEEQTGEAPASLECPDSLDAEVGATVSCTFVDSLDTEYRVEARAAEVDGNDVDFEWEVAEIVTYGAADLELDLSRITGFDATEVSCESELQNTADASVRCVVSPDDDEEFAAVATVEADGEVYWSLDDDE
ncbi:DUF4333 domain-containing protein [Hoyosella subflava]|uniref:DUF4333 domain-containing protein n=1 Tax=Hoyosella subflava (strain DSM 45089 / JCM 17490 / NBRC 109087 / DQS3-9A1) TaxID=443218 RepID=F6ENC1_HOYSD|nr:DUF4333 domain-containing protein [Hoyosella subflava]AEF40392.1 hypothetical protein AS9A_1943 [Hoyosella subflava DQS3-9A1]